jgi:hypothetical protein
MYTNQTNTHIGSTPGCGKLQFNITNSRNRVIRLNSATAASFTAFVRNNRISCPVMLERNPKALTKINGGVTINGRVWKKGQPCYFDGPPENAKNFGVVRGFVYWEDRFEATLIMQVDRYTLNHDGHQYTVPDAPDMASNLIFWSQLTHRCKMYPVEVDGVNKHTVVTVATTRPAVDGIDFDGVM